MNAKLKMNSLVYPKCSHWEIKNCNHHSYHRIKVKEMIRHCMKMLKIYLVMEEVFRIDQQRFQSHSKPSSLSDY